MTISTTASRISYNGNGATVAFSFPYRFLANRDIVVVLRSATGSESILLLGTHYTLSGAGSDAGGTVTMTTAPAVGERLVIYRNVAITQETDYISGDPFPAETHEQALDRLTMIDQQQQDSLDRTLRFPVSDTVSPDLPTQSVRANKLLAFDALGNPTTAVPMTDSSTDVRLDLAASTGTALIGANAYQTQAEVNVERVSVKRFGAVGDGVNDDSSAASSAINATNQRGKLDFPPAVAYKITETLQVFGKAGAVIDFGNQQINAGAFTSEKPAIHFKGMSQAVIDNIFVIGHANNTLQGVLFDADASNITIHARIGKIYAANCKTGIQVGANTHQFSDSRMEDLYASDCSTGIKFVGENTLAMDYGRVSAYNNTSIGIHFEQGGGSISSLQSAASGADLYFGQVDGGNHGKLARWDILSGYSEEGVNGERFIDSAKCTDTNPFTEQVVISGFRCTPFSSTNTGDFIRWRLNGDLILANVNINHGQQEPYIIVDHNVSYRAPRIELSGVIDCSPKSTPQVPMSYVLTDPRQTVEINSRVNNGITFWQNNGFSNEGIIKRGIYMGKLKKFEQALLSIGGLTGAWSLRDITSGQCRNLVLGGPNLVASASIARRDFWLDDGLVGFFRSTTASKTVSSSSSVYAKGEKTFGCILRATTAGVDETNFTTIGGSLGMRLGIGDTGGAFARCQVGAFNAQVTPTNPLDPHLLIGRWVPEVSTKIDCINLRTGERLSTTVGGPSAIDVTWADGVSIRNDGCVRGFPFIYGRALTDHETVGLLQSAMYLSDSWV